MHVAWWHAAIVLAAAQFVCAEATFAALAEDTPPEPTFLFFGGGDLWREGGFLHGGVVWSPQGVNDEGLALKMVFGGGAYRYESGALGNAEVTGRVFSASLMPGWRFRRGSLIATAYAGLDLQHHSLTPFDPGSSLHGGKAGLRTTVELWYEPTPTTMVAADATYSTIGAAHGGRIAYGWKFWNRFYLGPEAAIFLCDNYQQHRFGLHFTGLKTEHFELSGAIGFIDDSDERDGAYVRLGFLARR
jgi:hypothetical protein